MNACDLNNNFDKINNFIEEEIDKINYDNVLLDEQNLIQLENEISSYIESNSKIFNNYQYINFLNEKLKKNGINIIIDNPGKDAQQLNNNFNHLDISSDSKSMINIFGSNTSATNFILSKLNKLAVKYCIVDTDISTKDNIIDDNNKLMKNIIKLKNFLIESSIDLLESNDREKFRNIEIFDLKYGANVNAYNEFMSICYKQLKNFDPKKEEYSQDNKNTYDLFFNVFLLNNFDKLLEFTLKDIIIKDNKNSGNLNRNKYELALNFNKDIFLSTDLAYENTLNSINNYTRSIISTIPKLSLNIKDRKIIEISQGQTLTLPEILQLGAFMQSTQIIFNKYFNKNIDWYTDTENSIKTYLETIYNFVLNYKDINIKEKLTVEQINYENQFNYIMKQMGGTLSTAVSLYDYLYGTSDTRYNKNTKSIQQIIKQYTSFGKNVNLNIEHLLCQIIIQSVSPTFLEYASDGSLYDDESSEIYTNNVIQKASFNQQIFELKSIIRDLIHIQSYIVENNEFLNSLKFLNDILKKDKNNKIKFSELENDKENNKHLRIIIQKIFNIDINTNNYILSLLDEIPIFKNILKKLEQEILKIQKIKNDNNITEIQKQIINSTNEILSNVDITNLSQILNPILGKIPIPVFKNKEGNSIGVYRSVSTAFMFPHLIQGYKRNISETEKKLISEKNLEYIPLRNRCNILVDNPTLLSNENNIGYASQISIPLSMHGEEIRKLSALEQDEKSYIGDYLSLITSSKFGHSTSQMAIQMGSYSDKTTLPLLNINFESNLFNTFDRIQFKKIFDNEKLNADSILRLDYLYRSMNIIDVVDHVLDSWSKLIENFEFKSFKNDENFLKKTSESFKDHKKNIFKNKGNVFPLGFKSDKYHELIKNKIEYLNTKIKELNNLFSNIEINQQSKFLNDVRKVASDLNIDFVEQLFGTFYTDKGFQFNQTLEEDLNNLSSFDKFYDYSQKMFEKYAKDFKFDINRYPNILKDKIKNGNLYLTNLHYYTYLSNMFRHSALDLSVKECYVDKYKGKYSKTQEELDKQRHERLKTASKRYNIFTATFIPFMQNTLTGISSNIKITNIENMSGFVFNTIGQNTELNEYDGAGFVHPIQRRMEDASLCNINGMSSKKTFAPLVSDYYCGELKWASYELSNDLIRKSKNSAIDLEEIFKKLSSIPFPENINLCKFYYNQNNKFINFYNFIGKNVYYRDKFNYYQLIKLEKTSENNKYKIYYKQVNKYGKSNNEIIESKEVEINTIYDLYKVLGGYNSMELKNGELEYSEIVMDLLYKFVINVGNIKSKESIKENSLNQSNVNQPLRNCFINILSPVESNKRCQTNITSKEAWTNPNVSFNYSTVNFQTAGEQLKSEHGTSEEGQITEGTQLIQSMSQRGFTAEETNDLLNAIAKIMQINSKNFNLFVSLLRSKNKKELMKEISKKIISDLEINNPNFETQTLIGKLQNESNLENLILPLSLLTKETIKSLVVDLNKEVIKRQDAGLQGIINPSSGYLQIFNINGVNYTRDGLMSSENIKNLYKKCETLGINLNGFINQIENGYKIDPDKIITKLIIANLNCNFKECIDVLKNFISDEEANATFLLSCIFDLLLEDEQDELLNNQILFLSGELNDQNNNPININNFANLKKINPKLVEPGDTIITKNKEMITINNLSDLSLIQNEDYVLLRVDIPSDLKPAIYITNSDNILENSYTSEEALLGYDIILLSKGKNINTDRLKSFIKYINRFNNEIYDPDNIIEILKDSKNENHENIKQYLLECQEKIIQFKDHLKAYGILIKDSNSEDYFNNYYNFNIFDDFESQIKEKCIEDFFKLKNINIEKILNFNKQIPELKKRIEKLINKFNNDHNQIINFLKNNPEFAFDLIFPDKQLIFNEYLKSYNQFEKIKTEIKKNAQLIAPKNREQLKLGNVNLSEINPNFYKNFPTYYKLNENLITDEEIKLDFVVRSFSNKYQIVVTNDFNNSELNDLYGNVIPDNKIILDKENNRLFPTSKNKMYKLPDNKNEYQIRRKNGVETIIFIKNNSTIDNIKNLLNTDLNLISIQSFAYNLLNLKNNDELIELIKLTKELNTLDIFNNSADKIINILSNRMSIKKIKELNSQLKQDYKDLENIYKEKFRNSLYVAFQLSLKEIQSRIPTQNMSSIMSMDEVSFSNSNINNIFVSKWQQWIQGSDYDIDKDYILSYNFTDDGKFINWSPLFKINDKRLFDESLNLPLPTNKKLIIEENNNFDEYANILIHDYINLSYDNINDLIEKYGIINISTDLDINKEIIKLVIINKLLTRISKVGKLIINPNDELLIKENFNDLIKLIDRHNLYNISSEGIKNFMINKMHKVMEDHRNFITSQKSIDTATDKFNSEIKKIKDANIYNIDDNHSISQMTASAATGKDGVGISANGNKDYFSLLQYYNNYYREDPPFDVNDLLYSNKFNLEEILLRYTNESGDTEYFNKIVTPMSDVKLNKYVKNLYLTILNNFFGNEKINNFMHYENDAAQDLGAILSLAVDNAKSLSLDKMNASTDFLPVHLYLSSIGVPPEIIVKYFNSKVIKFIKKITPSNTSISSSLIREILNKINEYPEIKEDSNLIIDLIQLENLFLHGEELTNLALILKINQGVENDEKKLLNIKSKMNQMYISGCNSIKIFYDSNNKRFITLDKSKMSDDLIYKLKYFLSPSRCMSIVSNNIELTDDYINFINNKLQFANQAMEIAGIDLETPFNFDRFLSDKNYRDAIIKINDIYKKSINIFDALSNMSHFFGMISNYNQILEILSKVSSYFDFTIKKIYDLYDGTGIMNEKEFNEIKYKVFEAPVYFNSKLLNKAKYAYNDYIYSEFLKNILVNENFNYKTIQKTYNIEFDSNSGLHEFINLVNEIIIPQLMNKYSENKFLFGLQFNQSEFDRTGNNFKGFAENLKGLQNKTFDGSVKFNKILQSFNEIKDIKLSDILNNEDNKLSNLTLTIGDIFWLYNSIMNHAAPTITGFKQLFYDMYKNEDSLMYKYMKFIYQYDIGEKEINYDPDKLLGAMFRFDGRKTNNQIQFKSKTKKKPIYLTYNNKNGKKEEIWFINLEEDIHQNNNKLNDNKDIKSVNDLVNGITKGLIKLETEITECKI